MSILVAGGVPERLREVTDTLIRLGHHAFVEEDLARVGPVTSTIKPDVAIVVVGESSEHALAMIGKIVHEAACPVIALLDVEDSHFVKEAAKRGIFAYHQHRRSGGAREFLRHRPAQVRRVPRPGGSVL